MRIALCLSGHFRSYKKVFPFFTEYILKPLKEQGEVDIFISTWKTLHPKRGWHIPKKEIDSSEPVDIQDVVNCYRPKKLLMEGFDEIKQNFLIRNFTNKKIPEEAGIGDMGTLFSTPMFYKIASCNALKSLYEQEHNFCYDFVFRLRPDQRPDSEIDLNVLGDASRLTILSNNLVGQETRIDDTFFSGSSEVMDKTCSFYYNLVDIFAKCEAEIFGPEVLFGTHIKLRRIETRVVAQNVSLVR